jgi:hypothetical protein
MEQTRNESSNLFPLPGAQQNGDGELSESAKELIESKELQCPISLEPYFKIKDPVLLSVDALDVKQNLKEATPQIYERTELQTWIQNKKTSPYTRNNIQIPENEGDPDYMISIGNCDEWKQVLERVVNYPEDGEWEAQVLRPYLTNLIKIITQRRVLAKMKNVALWQRWRARRPNCWSWEKVKAFLPFGCLVLVLLSMTVGCICCSVTRTEREERLAAERLLKANAEAEED